MENSPQKNRPSRPRSVSPKRQKETLAPTDYVSAEQFGKMPMKRKDDLVPFEMRDLERIERKLDRARLGEKSKDFQNLAFLCVGIFFSLATFLLGLFLTMTVEIPKLVSFISLLGIFLSLILTIVFWLMSKKLGKIHEHYIEEVLDEIQHLKNKFQYVLPPPS